MERLFSLVTKQEFKKVERVLTSCIVCPLSLSCPSTGFKASNATPGIKHVYTTLMTLWKFFHYSPKRAKSIKEIQKVVDLPELKIVKPSDTRWLAHEYCVKAVKASYSSIVLALEYMKHQMNQKLLD